MGYVRVWQIVGCSKRGIPAVIPVSRATWWAGVKSGRYPRGVLLGPKIRAWNVEEIRELIASISTGDTDEEYTSIVGLIDQTDE
jgi:predicted DNA-binding transcriptional regulator AlpA